MAIRQEYAIRNWRQIKRPSPAGTNLGVFLDFAVTYQSVTALSAGFMLSFIIIGLIPIILVPELILWISVPYFIVATILAIYTIRSFRQAPKYAQRHLDSMSMFGSSHSFRRG